MKVELQADQIGKLPVHDAELFSIRIATSSNGETTTHVFISIDAEESMLPFFELGIQTQLVWVRFEKCWLISSNIRSYQTRREQIYDWRAASDSERITELRKSSVFSEASVLHHTFELSGGSMLEIIAENVFIEDSLNGPEGI